MFVVLGVLSSNAFALAPVGQIVPETNQGEWQAGVEWAYSTMSFSWPRYGAQGHIEMDTTTYFANIARGITDNFQIFFRGGISEMDYWRPGGNKNWTGGDSGALDIGGGIRGMIWQQSPELEWGGVIQYHRADYHGGRGSTDDDSGTFSTSLREWQLVFGPTWYPNDSVTVYGGVMWHLADGFHETRKEYHNNHALVERSDIGGIVGVGVATGENSQLSIEYQDTGDADAFCIGWYCRTK